MRVRHGIAAGVVALLASVWAGGAGAQAPMGDPLAARLDALAGAFMATEQVPGAIAAVVAGDRVILRGWGMSDLEARRPAGPEDTRFEIGSITKLFTWVLVMMLVEEGRIDLDADVAGYLRAPAVPGTEPLTLAHLMSHRPGFAESYAIFDPALGALPRPQALAASAPAQVFPRGAVTAYSNWGVALAGQIVEEVAGIPYEVLLKDRILDPLGMASTTLGEAARRPGQPPLARSYRVQGGLAHPAFRMEIGSFGPAGSLASTAADMARFLRFLMGDGSLDGERLLSPETMARMRTRLFDDRPQAADMAHGFQSRPMFGTLALGHAGGLNEFLSNLVFVPELGAGVFVSQNGGTGASLPFLVPDMILAALAAEAGLAGPPPPPVSDAAARAAEAAGRYLTNRRAFAGPAQMLAALSPLTVTPLPDGALLVPSAVLQSVLRYDPVAPDLWEAPLGDRLWLIRDAEGRVLRLADGTGTQTLERLRGLGDPLWLWAAAGAAALLGLTTLLGAVRRRGLRGGGLAAVLGLAGAAAVWALVGTSVWAGLAAARLGAEFLFDQPQPALTALLALGDAVAVLAVLGLLALVPVWRAAGWSLGRRLHQSAFSLALAALAVLMLRWGLAFGGALW